MKKLSEYSNSIKALKLADIIEGDTFFLSVINGKIFAEGIYEWDEDEDPVKSKETLENVSYGLLDVLTSSLENVKDISKGNGLADFIKEEYKKDVKSIIFDHTYVCGKNGQIATVFKVEFNKFEPTHYIEDIIDYIGRFLVDQCSDGWGEAFEQRPFCEEAEEYCDMIGDLFFSSCTLDSNWIPEIKLTIEFNEDEEYFEESSVSTFRKKLEERSKLKKDIKNLLNN